jgi:hypothetical protein
MSQCRSTTRPSAELQSGSASLPWPRPDNEVPALPHPPKGGPLPTPQASLDATDRLSLPHGLVTLGFNPGRVQTAPPACYRASWQIPGLDSNRQATASLSLSDHLMDYLQRLGDSKHQG